MPTINPSSDASKPALTCDNSPYFTGIDLRPDPRLHGSVLVLGRNGTALSKEHVVGWNAATPREGLRLLDLTGESDAPATIVQFRITIPSLPSDTTAVLFVASTGEDQETHHFLGDTGGAYVRIIATDTGEELARYDVTDELSTETALVLAQLYEHKRQWRFRAVGQPYTTGLAGVAHSYGFRYGDTTANCCGPVGRQRPGKACDIPQSTTASERRSP